MNKNIKSISSILAAAAVITGSVVLMSGKKTIDKDSVDYSAIEASENAFTPVLKDENTDIAQSNEISGKINNPKEEFSTVKDEIWHKMLNSTDYIHSVSGKMIYSDGIGADISIEYQSDLDNAKAYTKVSDISISNTADAIMGNAADVSVSNNVTEVFTDSDSMVFLNNADRTAECNDHFVRTRESDCEIDDSERVTADENGIPIYRYRADITNTYLAKASLVPQEMTFGFLTDFDAWKVDGIEEYAGRKCYVISGKATESYGAKLNVEKFVFYTDCETGVLLKYIGYDSSQNISSYIVTENISFNDMQTVYKPDTANYIFTE